MANKWITGFILIAGIINALPVIGVWSGETLANLYRIDAGDSDIVLLLRHRAVLFGLLGGYMCWTAFRPELHVTGIVVGLIAMAAFIALVLSMGIDNPAIRKVMWIDVAASFGLVIALALRLKA